MCTHNTATDMILIRGHGCFFLDKGVPIHEQVRKDGKLAKLWLRLSAQVKAS